MVLEIAPNGATGLAIIDQDIARALSSVPQEPEHHDPRRILELLTHSLPLSHPPRLVASIVRAACFAPEYDALRPVLWPRLWAFVCPYLREHILGPSRSRKPPPSFEHDRDVVYSIPVLLLSPFYGGDFNQELLAKIAACSDFFPTLVELILALLVLEVQHSFVYKILSSIYSIKLRNRFREQLRSARQEFDIPTICEALFKRTSLDLQSRDSIPKFQLNTEFVIDCLKSFLYRRTDYSSPEYSSPEYFDAVASYSRLVGEVAPYLIACATSFDAESIVDWGGADIHVTISTFTSVSECLILAAKFGHGIVSRWLDEGLLIHLVTTWRSGVHKNWPDSEISGEVDSGITKLLAGTGEFLTYRSINFRAAKQMAGIRATGVLDAQYFEKDPVFEKLVHLESSAKSISKKRLQFDMVCGTFPCSWDKCPSRERYIHQLTRSTKRRNEDLKKYGLIADDPRVAVFDLSRAKRRVKWRWCSRCHNAVYCTDECQRAHWKEYHREECFVISPIGTEAARPAPSNLDVHFIRYLVKRDLLGQETLPTSGNLSSKKPYLLHYDMSIWPLELETIEISVDVQTRLRAQLPKPHYSSDDLLIKVSLPTLARVIYANENILPIFSVVGTLSHVTVKASPFSRASPVSSNPLPSFSRTRHDSSPSPDSQPFVSSSAPHVPDATVLAGERGPDSSAKPRSLAKTLPGLRGLFKKSGI